MVFWTRHESCEKVIVYPPIFVVPFKAFLGQWKTKVNVIHLWDADVETLFETTLSHFENSMLFVEEGTHRGYEVFYCLVIVQVWLA